MEAALKEDIRIFSDFDSLGFAAAELFMAAADQAIDSRGRFSVALSGGSTPLGLYHILGTAYHGRSAWEHTHLFWADERCVPKDHVLSNYRLAYIQMISRLTIPQQNIHRIKGELAPEEAAGEYEEDLKRHIGEKGTPRLDLILLGLGEDGHTASLYPGSASLSETEHLVLPVFAEATMNWRVTLTLPVLNNALRIVFLVSGRPKAGIVREILGQGRKDRYPAGRVAPSQGSITWLLDKDAASGLEESAS
jgi:6-phosphogluconolactonase